RECDRRGHGGLRVMANPVASRPTRGLLAVLVAMALTATVVVLRGRTAAEAAGAGASRPRAAGLRGPFDLVSGRTRHAVARYDRVSRLECGSPDGCALPFGVTVDGVPIDGRVVAQKVVAGWQGATIRQFMANPDRPGADID